MSKALYVLGGMGPQASVEFYRLMIDKAQRSFGVQYNDEYPEVIVHSLPVPDFISDQTKRGIALEMLQQRLSLLSPDVYQSFAIACNTAHLLAPELVAGTSIKFVSMIDEVGKRLHGSGASRVGLLASPVTIDSRLYQNALHSYCIQTIVPEKSELPIIETAIRSVIANEAATIHKKSIEDIADRLIERGADFVVLGCTELPVIFRNDMPSMYVSSTECLAQALLERYYTQTPV